MATPITWLQEFITNLVTANAQANPRVVGLANGNFLVVWEDDDDSVADGFETDIVGVIFNALGEAITPSLYLNFPFGFTRAEGLEAIAATPSGGFVVVYEFRSGNDGDLLMGLYDANGSRIAQEFVVSDDSVNGITYDNASVDVSPDGSFFVTFERDDGTNQDILGQKYTATGNLDGTIQELRVDGFSNGADLEDILEPDTVALSDGRFATVYTENDSFGGVNERTVELRFTNADGTNSALLNAVSATDGDPDSNPRVIELTDGRIMVAWQEDGDIRARIYNSDTTTSVAEFPIINGSLFFTLIDIVALDNNAYGTVFRDDTLGRLLVNTGLNGSQTGFTTFISDDASGTGGAITNVSASATTDGRILVSWENGEIYTEILDPREVGAAINADEGDGQITGLRLASTINGSDDAESIFGVDGNDTIFGNGGNDLINGGIGDDDMFGGLGDDTFVIDSANDTVTEFAGEGFDRIITFININPPGTRYLNVESFELSGTAIAVHGTNADEQFIANSDSLLNSRIFAYGGNDTIFGAGGNDRIFAGAGDDTIFGGNGNDRIDGGAGADIMEGGAGNDNYFVDNIGDIVLELPGDGRDFVRSFVDFTLGSNIELLRIALNGTVGNGNNIDNTIVSAGGAATLRGFDGDDNIRGSQFDDIILGGRDNDTINGRNGADTIDGGSGNDEINGSNGNDIIDGGSGDDTIFGGRDDDTITGGGGRDTMRGDIGADTFIFDDGHFSGLTDVTADRITDFDQAESDLIDLSLVDAIAGGSDDALTFIGNAAFSGTAGELRFEQSSGVTMVYMDTNGNGNANFAIALNGLIALTEADFVL